MDSPFDLIEKYRDGVDIYSVTEEEQAIIMWLTKQGYFEFYGGSLSSTVYVLTTKGKAFLSAKEQNANAVADEMARKHREKISDRRFEIVKMLLSAVIGGIVTLAVEHFDAIVCFLTPH